MARSMLSFGMFSRLHVAMIERSVGFVSGSGPPAFTAIAICLPRRVNVFAMCPQRFNFAALRYSNALPIGLLLFFYCCCCFLCLWVTSFYLNSALSCRLRLFMSLFIIVSICLSPIVFSGSCSMKLTAYDFLPSGSFSPS